MIDDSKNRERAIPLRCLAALFSALLLLGCARSPKEAAPSKLTSANENSPSKTNTPVTDTADRVEGTLTVNGKPVNLTQGYVWTSKGAFDEAKTDIHVTIVDRPLPEEKYKGAMGLMGDNEAQGLELTIDDERRIIGAQVYHAALQHRYFSSSGSLEFEPVTFDKTTVEGRVKTDGPQETFGDKWECNVSFRVKVQPGK